MTTADRLDPSDCARFGTLSAIQTYYSSLVSQSVSLSLVCYSNPRLIDSLTA